MYINVIIIHEKDKKSKNYDGIGVEANNGFEFHPRFRGFNVFTILELFSNLLS